MEKNSYENIPIIPLRGLIVFPFTLVSFDVGRDKSVAAIELAQKNEQLIFVSAQKNHRQSEISSDNIYTTGCLCRIKAVSRLIGDTIHVTVEGLSRAKVVRFIQHDNLIAADIVLFDESVNSDKALALRPTISEKLNELINASSRPGIQESLMLIEKAIMSYDYMFKAANLIILKADERQQYIEQEDFEQQCVMLISIINREIELATLSKRIDQRVKEQIDKNQKEYVLREQIRAIRAELGENEQMESDEFRKRLASREFPPAIKAKLGFNNKQFGLFGSLFGFGRMLGGVLFMTLVSSVNRKYLLFTAVCSKSILLLMMKMFLLCLRAIYPFLILGYLIQFMKLKMDL